MNIIDVVGRFAIAPQYPFDANLRVARPLPCRLPDVVKYQLHAGASHRFAIRGAVENHVLHGFAAQRGRPRFAQDPAHRIDHIGFAAAIGTHDPDQITGNRNFSGIDKGLETG